MSLALGREELVQRGGGAPVLCFSTKVRTKSWHSLNIDMITEASSCHSSGSAMRIRGGGGRGASLLRSESEEGLVTRQQAAQGSWRATKDNNRRERMLRQEGGGRQTLGGKCSTGHRKQQQSC